MIVCKLLITKTTQSGDFVYKYNICGLIIEFNTALPLLNELRSTDVSVVDFRCVVLYTEKTTQEISVRKYEQKYIIKLGIHGTAEIDLQIKTCFYHVKSINDLLATFFNMPLSVIIISNQKGLLLHSAAVEYKNFSFAFVAEKGGGKSTFANMLLQDPDISFFTDDSLRIDCDVFSYRSTNFQKLKSVNCKLSEYACNTNVKISGKSCVIPYRNCEATLPLKAMFFIHRADVQEIRITKSNNNNHWIQTTANTISSWSFCQTDLLYVIDVSKQISDKICFWDLYIPNNLQLVEKEIFKMKYKLESIIEQY